MKNKLKALVAGTLGVCAMAMVGVAKVEATEIDCNVVYEVSDDLKTASWDAMAATSGVKIADGNSFAGILVAGGTVTGKGTYLSIPAGVSLSLPVPKDSAGSIKVYADANNSARGYNVENSTVKYVSTKDNRDKSNPCVIPFTQTDTVDSNVTITTYGGELKPYAIDVLLTTGEFEATAKVYTVSYYFEGTVLSTEKVTSGEKITNLNPKLFAYDFLGFYTDEELINSFDATTNTITEDTNLYLKFTKKSSYVVENANTLSNSLVDELVNYYENGTTLTKDVQVVDTIYTVLNACKMQSSGGKNCIGTAGGVSQTQKGIKFTAPENGIISVSMTTAGTGARSAKMINTSGTSIIASKGNVDWTKEEATAYEVRTITYNVDKGTTYVLGGTDGMRIFSVDFEANPSATFLAQYDTSDATNATKIRFVAVLDNITDVTTIDTVKFTLTYKGTEKTFACTQLYRAVTSLGTTGDYAAKENRYFAVYTIAGDNIAAAIGANETLSNLKLTITFTDGTTEVVTQHADITLGSNLAK